MAILKCKMCGGNLEIQEDQTVVECEYCGTKQTIPTLDNEKKISLFTRANKLRASCEFDKAYGVYESIVAEFNEEAEAYWGLILCKYGIEYVDDPITGKKIPTCHRSSYDSVMEDENFEMVMENADSTARTVYREEAKAIEKLRNDIIEVSSKEEPYDIFICYKETDLEGERTIDSVIAQDVYDELTDKGYRVFFSRITLEDKLGQEYEPYIFAALNSAKIMLVFGTDYEYFNAVWVKNEWSRFLGLIEKGEKKNLIPCYKDIDAYDMPKEFKKLQGQDMGKIGAIQDLIRGVNKILERDNPVVKEAVINQTNSNIEPLLKRVFMFLEDKEWSLANEYCEKVLDINPENARAYLGKLMVDLNVSKQNDLKNQKEPFVKNNNYKKVLKFADKKLKEELQGTIDFIINRNLSEQYDKAVKYMQSSDLIDTYIEASKMFDKIGNYKDSKQLKEKCLATAKEYRMNIDAEKNKCEELVKLYNEQEIYKRSKKANQNKINNLRKEIDPILKKLNARISLKNEWHQIEEQISSLNENIEYQKKEIERLNHEKSKLGLFAGRQKKEVQEQIYKLEDEKTKLINNLKDVEIKKLGFNSEEKLQAYIDELQSKVNLKNEEISKLEELINKKFEKSKEQIIDELNLMLLGKEYLNKLIFNKDQARKGKTFTFGKYGNKPIEWVVLDEQDDKALVISKYGLIFKTYDIKERHVTWEACTLREYLNNGFTNYIFSDVEKLVILTTTVTADKNPGYNTYPGNNTNDKLFLLSIDEVNRYFNSDNERKCYMINENSTYNWWLRTPGYDQHYAAYVHNDGRVDEYGNNVGTGRGSYAVRPAMWIILE